MPVTTTGDITRQAIAEQVLASGVAVAGIGTALSVAPDPPRLWRNGYALDAAPEPVNWKDKTLSSIATMTLVRRRLRTISAGGDSGGSLSPLWTLITDQFRVSRLTRRYRNWRTALIAD